MFDLLWFCLRIRNSIRACGDANTYYAFELQAAPNTVGNVTAPSERLLSNHSIGPCERLDEALWVTRGDAKQGGAQKWGHFLAKKLGPKRWSYIVLLRFLWPRFWGQKTDAKKRPLSKGGREEIKCACGFSLRGLLGSLKKASNTHCCSGSEYTL